MREREGGGRVLCLTVACLLLVYDHVSTVLLYIALASLSVSLSISLFFLGWGVEVGECFVLFCFVLLCLGSENNGGIH